MSNLGHTMDNLYNLYHPTRTESNNLENSAHEFDYRHKEALMEQRLKAPSRRCDAVSAIEDEPLTPLEVTMKRTSLPDVPLASELKFQEYMGDGGNTDDDEQEDSDEEENDEDEEEVDEEDDDVRDEDYVAEPSQKQTTSSASISESGSGELKVTGESSKRKFKEEGSVTLRSYKWLKQRDDKEHMQRLKELEVEEKRIQLEESRLKLERERMQAERQRDAMAREHRAAERQERLARFRQEQEALKQRLLVEERKAEAAEHLQKLLFDLVEKFKQK